MTRSPFISVPFDHVIPPTRYIPESAKAKLVSALRSRQRPADVQALQRLTSIGSVSYLHQICRALAIDGRVNVFRKINAGQTRFYKLADRDDSGPLFGVARPSSPTPAPEPLPDPLLAPEPSPEPEPARDDEAASIAAGMVYGFELRELQGVTDEVQRLFRQVSRAIADNDATEALGGKVEFPEAAETRRVLQGHLESVNAELLAARERMVSELNGEAVEEPER
jgi:hypothetical protein